MQNLGTEKTLGKTKSRRVLPNSWSVSFLVSQPGQVGRVEQFQMEVTEEIWQANSCKTLDGILDQRKEITEKAGKNQIRHID